MAKKRTVKKGAKKKAKRMAKKAKPKKAPPKPVAPVAETSAPAPVSTTTGMPSDTTPSGTTTS